MSIILKVENISKQYRLGLVGTGTISHDFNRWWHRIRGKEDPYLKIGAVNDRSANADSDYVWALQNINFEVQQGEVLGIIGKNGAGKSTLLKILSRVTSPTTGDIKTKGRIASLLEVGTGFHPELTGRENIYLNGAILGMTKAEIKTKEEEIIDFSGCQMYIDTPVKRYSSGMRVRLAFAVAAFLEPDILVIDEVLAVGDNEFQKKAIGKMQDISQGEGRTVLFVSHNMASVKKLCTRGLLLENGMIKSIGDIDSILELYQGISQGISDYHAKKQSKELYFKSITFANNSNSYYCVDEILFLFDISFKTLINKNVFLLIRVMDFSDQVLFSNEMSLKADNSKYKFTIPRETLVKGSYKLNCIIYQPGVCQYDYVEETCSFHILNNNDAFSHLETFDIGKIYVPQNWIK